MKNTRPPKYFVAAIGFATIAISSAPAQAQLYWDSNSTTAGFGNANGTWGTSNFWNTDITGGAGTFSTPTTSATDVHFGTALAGYTGGRTVSISGTQTANSITIGSASNAVTFSGGTAFNLGNANTVITQNSASDTNISTLIGGGTNGLTKAGAGRLVLTGNNNYTGNTVVSGGTLRFGNTWSNSWTGHSLDNNSNLEINNGIVEAYYYLTRTLGTGAGQIQLTGGRAGFSNMQGDASGNPFIRFTDNATTVTWGSTTFNPSTLVLNDTGASSVLRTVNPFNLNGAPRTVEVSATGVGGGRGTYATMEGNLSGAGGSLVKTGVGTLMLNGTNSYGAGTTINGGAVWFNKLVSMPNSGAVAVNDGGILAVSVGSAGEWTTGTSGNGTIGGLLAGLGGAGTSTVSYSGNIGLGINVNNGGTQTYTGNINNVGTTLSLYVGNKDGGTASDPFGRTSTLILSGNNGYTGSTNIGPNSTLRLLTTAAASASSSLNLANTSTLQLRNDTDATFFSGAPVNFTTAAAGTVTIDVGNNGLGSGNQITLGSELNRRLATNTAGTLIVTSADAYSLAIPAINITGGNSLTLNPTTAAGISIGTLTATTGATAFSGANNISLTLGGSAGTNSSIDSILETSGAGQQLGITKNTAATWTVGNVNVRAGNNHSVSAGILKLNGTFEWTDANFDRNIRVEGTGQLHYNNAGALKTLNGRLRMVGGSMDNTSGAAITTSTHNPNLELAGDWTFIGSNGADSDLNFGTGAVRIVGTSGTNRTITVQNANTQLTLGGAISSNAAWNSGAAPGAAATNGLIKAGDGTLVLTGANTYTGNTAINGGTLEIGSTASLPGWNVNGRYSVANNATLAVRNAVTDGQIASMLGTTNFQAGSRLGFDTESGDRTYSPTITDTTQGALGLTKMGANTLTITGTNSYTGATNVNAGTLRIDGSGAINTSSAINVAAGASFVYNSSVALTVAPTLNGTGTGASQRATLGGEGTINASVTLDNLGDVLSPGNSPGNLNFATSQSWASFTYEWELNSWNNQAANTNFDTISITGNLNLTGVISNSYTLDINSLTGLNVAGTLDDFSEINRTWTILTTTGGINGFDAAFWDINTAGFLPNTFTGTWSLGLGNSDRDLVLSYAALSGPLDVIPEPSTALLGAISLLAVLRRRR